MQVQLFKKVGTYIDKKDNNKEKRFVNFYVKCGDALIPVEVPYFPNDKFDGRDPQYSGRKEVLSAFAAILPDKPDKSDNVNSAQAAPDTARGNPPITDMQPVDDGDMPF